MRVYLVLGVVLLAVLGALLHPLSLLLALLPANTHGLEAGLTTAKTLVADFLAWALVALILVMAWLVVRGRLSKGRAHRVSASGAEKLPVDPRYVRFVVGIIAYNEAEAIAAVVRDFVAQSRVVEVVVVDNNSRDRTAALAQAAGAQVVREPRQGYGYACLRALQEGLKVEEADAVVLVEGDGTFSAGDLEKFAAYIGQADMVVGTRVVRPLVEPGSQMDYFFTWGNIAVGTLLRLRFWNTQFLGAASLSDVGCTYRAIRRQALAFILPDLGVGGHHFSPHMMLVALARGCTLIEIPVTFRRRIGHSKGASRSAWKGLGVGLAMIWHILTYAPKTAAHSIDPAEVLSEPLATEATIVRS